MAEDLKEKDEDTAERSQPAILFDTNEIPETYEDDGGENICVVTHHNQQDPSYEHVKLTQRIRKEMLKYQKTQGLPLCEFLTNDLLSSFIQWTVENVE